MSVIRRGTAVAAAAVVALTLLPGLAAADSVSQRDPKDTRGRLDISRIGHGHAGDDAVVHTISTHRRFSSRLLRSGGIFLGIDTDGRFTDLDGLERWVDVYWHRGALRAAVWNARTGRRVGSARVARPNRRTIRLTIPKRLLGNPPGYRWMAASVLVDAGGCRDFCIDFAPNSAARHTLRPRDLVLHDYTAPNINFDPLPASTEDDWVLVSFTVADKGFSGLANWKVQRRIADGDWITVASGTRGGSFERVIPLDLAGPNEFRIVAADRHGNFATSIVRTVEPPPGEEPPPDDAAGVQAHTASR